MHGDNPPSGSKTHKGKEKAHGRVRSGAKGPTSADAAMRIARRDRIKRLYLLRKPFVYVGNVSRTAG